MADDPNKPETEEEAIRAEALRRLKVRLMYSALPAQTRDSSASPSSTPATTESSSDAKPNTSK